MTANTTKTATDFYNLDYESGPSRQRFRTHISVSSKDEKDRSLQKIAENRDVEMQLRKYLDDREEVKYKFDEQLEKTYQLVKHAALDPDQPTFYEIKTALDITTADDKLTSAVTSAVFNEFKNRLTKIGAKFGSSTLTKIAGVPNPDNELLISLQETIKLAAAYNGLQASYPSAIEGLEEPKRSRIKRYLQDVHLARRKASTKLTTPTPGHEPLVSWRGN